MIDKDIINEVNALPPEGRRMVEDFIAFLKQRYGYSCEVKPAPQTPVENEEFIGMWKDREDMTDSHEWVRKLRESEWVR